MATRLSFPGLETLAIVAYRQPIGRAEIEEIRGVGAAGALKTLIERGLVEVTARGEGLGRPLLYGTTRKFLEHFGFRSLEDLPRPEELPVVLQSRRATESATADLPEPETIAEPATIGPSADANGTDPHSPSTAPEAVETAAPEAVFAGDVVDGADERVD